MVPVKLEVEPRFAELVTCQKTLHAWAPLVRVTVLPDAVLRADPAWKMKSASGSPPPSRVSDPLSWMVEPDE
jgi:hypothetical protein